MEPGLLSSPSTRAEFPPGSTSQLLPGCRLGSSNELALRGDLGAVVPPFPESPGWNLPLEAGSIQVFQQHGGNARGAVLERLRMPPSQTRR